MENTIKYSGISALILTIGMFITSCNGEKGPEGQQGTNNETAGAEEVITVTREEYTSSGMSLTRLDTADFFVTVHANGYIRVLPQKQAAISTYQGGFIEKINVQPGDSVRKGDRLVILSSPDYIMLQLNYLETLAQTEYLKKEYERQKTLSDANIASIKNFQKVKSDYAIAVARLNGYREQLKLLNIPVGQVEQNHLIPQISLYAPFSGVVKSVETILGSYVSPSDVIVRIIDHSSIHLLLNVFENDVMKIGPGQKVVFHTIGADRQIFSATVYLVGKSLDEKTRTVKVYARPEQKDIPFVQGMYIEAEILTDRITCPYLPEKAVVQQGERYLVLVKTGEKGDNLLFRKTEVKTGRKEEKRVEIRNPEVIGNREVLANGAYFLL